MRFRQLTRKIRLALSGRIDCAPRFDSRAPFPELDAMGFEGATDADKRPVVVVPINRHSERVYWGSGAAQFFVRYTSAWHEDEARAYADAWAQVPVTNVEATKNRRRWRDRA